MTEPWTQRAMAWGTIFLGIVGIGSLVLTFMALKETRHEFAIIQQPEVAVMDTGISIYKIGAPVEIRTDVTNAGKGTALVCVRGDVRFGKKPYDIPWNKIAPPISYNAAVQDGVDMAPGVPNYWVEVSREPLTPELDKAIHIPDARMVMIVLVVLDYWDNRKMHYVRRMCEEWIPNRNKFYFCPKAHIHTENK